MARLIDRLPSDMPPAALGPLERTVLTCLRKSPDARFASAADLVAALERAREALTTPLSGVAALSGSVVAPRVGVAWWWWV
jgi:hypothetical protein